MGPKINVKERFSDGEIDLSMSDIEEVPVKEIAQLKKAYSLDLSNNRLSVLPKNFVTLTYLTKLDLSKNELRELPEDFGNLSKLKHLDLYQNQLQHLPLSFCKLKDLKWLDLKDNPLVPTVAKIAGPCLETKQCQNCARDIVNFFSKLEHQVNSELEMRNKTRQKQLEINQQKKQQEKKNKKKDKQKQKHENVVVNNGTASKGKQKKDNNKKSLKLVAVQEKSSSSLLGKLLLLLFSTSVVLFILTSIKSKPTESIEDYIRNLYLSGFEKLPPSWKVYVVHGENILRNAHVTVGNVTMNVITFINDKVISKQKCEELLENFSCFSQSVGEKIREFYNDLVHA